MKSEDMDLTQAEMFSSPRYFYPSLAHICGDNTNAGLLLSHLNFHWFHINRGRPFHRTDVKLILDTTLSINQLKAARGVLRDKEFITVERTKSTPPKNLYTLNYNTMISAYKEWKVAQIAENHPNGLADTSQIVENHLDVQMQSDPTSSVKATVCNEQEIGAPNGAVVLKEKYQKESREIAPTSQKSSSKSDTEDEDGFRGRMTAEEKKKAEVEADPKRWNSYNFRKYLAKKYEAAYKRESLEYKHKQQGNGKIIGMIKKQLLEKFTRDFSLTILHVKEYIEWVYGSDDGKVEGKCKEIHKRGSEVNFGFLASDNLISEWWTKRGRENYDSTVAENKKTAEIIKSRTIN